MLYIYHIAKLQATGYVDKPYMCQSFNYVKTRIKLVVNAYRGIQLRVLNY